MRRSGPMLRQSLRTVSALALSVMPAVAQAHQAPVPAAPTCDIHFGDERVSWRIVPAVGQVVSFGDLTLRFTKIHYVGDVISLTMDMKLGGQTLTNVLVQKEPLKLPKIEHCGELSFTFDGYLWISLF